MKDKVKKWYQQWWGIMLLLLLTSILSVFFAFAFTVNHMVNEIKSKQIDNYDFSGMNLTDEERLKIEGNNNNWIGSPNPQVTIVEFGDYSCPMCKKSFTKIREISTRYPDKIKYIYRDYPTVSEDSQNLAMAARCAGEQGLFWLMHDKLFLNQGITTNEDIYSLALQSGADEERFLDCMTNNKYLVQIQKDVADANSLEIPGTPTWYINGIRFSGDIPYEFFNQLIDKLLK